MRIARDHRARWLAPALAALLVVLLASPSSASPVTLTRSVQNLLFGPFDFFLGPVVGTRAVYTNIQDINDSTGVRVAYVVPGLFWNSAMCMGGGVLRLISGMLELVPGIVLLPFEADMDPIYAPAEKSDALIWEVYDNFEVKIGINYVE